MIDVKNVDSMIQEKSEISKKGTNCSNNNNNNNNNNLEFQSTVQDSRKLDTTG